MTAARSFDTVENRVLVAALDAIARAGRALRGPTGERVDPAEVDRIAAVAEEARHWRNHPHLADVRPSRLSARNLARLRGGHRLARLGPVLAIRRRVAEPFVADDVVGLSDDATRAYHRAVLRALDAVDDGPWSLADDRLRHGPVSFRHPAADGHGQPGLWVHGTPVVPSRPALDGLEWADRLPGHGVEIDSAQERALLGSLSSAPIPR